ncbi:MAG TPA: DUF4258 domain-containing protein [Chitinophagaceae bacterium]|nr:DUF4258 domain-containing protein [Chitinophagaceae bacterium]
MRPKNVIVTLVLLVGLFLFAIYRKHHEPQRKEAFDRTPQRLQYYAFALCRMQCLTISKADIKTLMQTGVINLNKSSRAVRPCPVFALQGRVQNTYMRVLFEQCRNGTFVVTVYNLQRDDTCRCATDYQPNQP